MWLNLCRTNGQGVYILFSLVGKKDQKSTRRVCAPSRLPWDAVKLRLRFASQVLRRYWKFQIFIRRKKHIFYFCLSDIELTQAKFYIIFEFLFSKVDMGHIFAEYVCSKVETYLAMCSAPLSRWPRLPWKRSGRRVGAKWSPK